MSLLTLALQLSFVNAANFVDGGDLIHRFVVAKMGDAREAQRVARLVTLRFLNAVKRDLQHDGRLDGEHRAVAASRRLLEMFGETRDLDVGEARVRLADVHQLMIAADRE